jgi:hypothetical protein
MTHLVHLCAILIPSGGPLLSKLTTRRWWFHFQFFQSFVIGQDLNSKDDIVKLNFSMIWHLCNFLRNIAAGWYFQVNGNGTYRVCRCTFAFFSLGVNLVQHINNPVCWAIMPETESKEICQGTWRAAQDPAMLVIKSYRVCDDPECRACSTVRYLLQEKLVVDFRATNKFRESLFPVDVTL